MNKKFFLPIAAVLVITATFLSCQKDNEDGNKVKLLKFARYNHSGTFTRYDYDTQHRLTTISQYFYNELSSTLTLTYSGNDLVGFGDYTLTMVDFTQSSYKFTFSNGIKTFIYDLNSDGTLAKISSDNLETNFQYQNGNLTKITSEWSNEQIGFAKTTNEYTYDSRNSPFLNCKTPKWWLIGVLCDYQSCINNITGDAWTSNELSGTTVYTYEYDNEGYPTELRAMYGNQNASETFFSY